MTVTDTTTRPLRAERVAEARRLRGLGLTNHQVGREMGISTSYAASLLSDPDGSKDRARKARYAGVCGRCGGPTSGGDGRPGQPKLCRGCAPASRWDRDAILEALLAFFREHGRYPRTYEWVIATEDHPPNSAVYRAFHRWPAAILAAERIRSSTSS